MDRAFKLGIAGLGTVGTGVVRLLNEHADLLAERSGLGATGIWIAYPIQNVLTALIVVIWFARGTWKHRNVIEEPAPESAVSRYRPGSVTNTTLR